MMAATPRPNSSPCDGQRPGNCTRSNHIHPRKRAPLSSTPLRTWLPDFLLLSMLWGSSYVFMRWGAVHFGALPTAWLRVSVAMLVLLPWVQLKGLMPQVGTHWRATFIMGSLNSAIPFALLAYAVNEMTTGLASILNATTPLFGALVAWLWLKDKPTAARSLGLAIGFLGVALLTLGRNPDAALNEQASNGGILACLAATFFYGTAACFAQRHLRSIPPLATAFGSMIGASLLLVLPAWWFWPAQTPPWSSWAAIVALGALCTACAYALYFKLNARIGATKAMTVTYLIPLFASLLGVVLFDEHLSLISLLSGLTIMLGTALASGVVVWPRPKEADKQASE